MNTDPSQVPPLAPANDPPDKRYGGLLAEVMANTLDEDYRLVSSRATSSATKGAGVSTRLALVISLVAFGAMVGVSAAQTERDQPSVSAERAEIIDQIHGRQTRLDALHGGLADVQASIASLQASSATELADNQQLVDRLSSLGAAAGAVAVVGPGVVVTVDDAPDASNGSGGTILDTDLQVLVNALWEAGAEAIAVDGHRITSLTSIRFAGQAITVDYRSLSPPYVLQALGDPDTLPARLLQTTGGQIWEGLNTNFGITFDTVTVTKDKIMLPADPLDHLLYAHAADGER
ncbi:MAG: DUF881 domain-containing protein [Nocardioidaceae bacterium]